MGVSDRHYFAWLAGALDRFERESGDLAAVGAARPDPCVWVLAGARPNPSIERVVEALGRERATVRYLDKFERAPGVARVDFNALGDLPADACDVLMMTRASYMIGDAAAFLRDARRILRPGGLMIVDWVHGGADAPRLDLPGRHDYEGGACPFRTTYADPESLADLGGEFDAFIRHVNRPPAWVNVERPGAPVPLGVRLRRVLGRRGGGDLTRASYLQTLREALRAAGKQLLEPETLGASFTVRFRDARYLYPLTGKFHLHLLTVLRPVGK